MRLRRPRRDRHDVGVADGNGVRQATPRDAPELVRLRAVMLRDTTGIEPEPGPWQQHALAMLGRRLAEPDGDFVVFVVDAPGAPGRLACCVLGSIEYRIAGPHNPTGTTGYVFNVATDPGYRRRGYARTCMESMLDWYRRRGVSKVDLRASGEGEPLYRSLGFARSADPAMRLNLQ
jgi:GNAT superfamily N-acetyltransferase